MSDFTVSIRAESFLARIEGMGARLHESVLRAVTRLSIDVQDKVKDKLSGPVLHVGKTGTLRRSINRVVRDQPSEIMAQVGTNLVYAAVHEYGFDGIVNVREYTRRSAAQLAVGRKSRAKKSEGTITVRAHTMHMRVPERSYLRSTVREQAGAISGNIKAAAREALQR